MNGTRTAPVNAGETYEVSIESVGGKGDGVAKVKGFVLFVPNVKKGDYVKIKITKVLPSVGFAEVVEKLDAPPQQQQYQQKYVSVSQEEMNQEKEPETHYEDSEDFGEEKETEEKETEE